MPLIGWHGNAAPTVSLASSTSRKIHAPDPGPEARPDRLLDQGLIALLQCSPAAFNGEMVPDSAPGGSVPARPPARFEFALWDINSQPPDVRCWRCKPTPRPVRPPRVMLRDSTSAAGGLTCAAQQPYREKNRAARGQADRIYAATAAPGIRPTLDVQDS